MRIVMTETEVYEWDELNIKLKLQAIEDYRIAHSTRAPLCDDFIMAQLKDKEFTMDGEVFNE